MTAGRATTPWYETAFGAHYPDLYAHRDDDEARRCLDLLPRLASLGPGPILDLGCGQGRHLRELLARGCRSLGLDLSPPLLQRARRELPHGPLVRGDMRRLPLQDGSCSAVLSLFTAFGYFADTADDAAVVGEVARVLTPQGHWFLDFLDSERVAAELAGKAITRERESRGVRISETRHLAFGPRRVIKTVSLVPLAGSGGAPVPGIGPEGLTYEEVVTLFTLEELDGLAAGAGLRRVAAAGDYEGAPLVPGDCGRWLLVYGRDGHGKDGP